MDSVSQLTINGETREIVDAKSRDDIAELEEKIEELQSKLEYMAGQLNIVFPD